MYLPSMEYAQSQTLVRHFTNGKVVTKSVGSCVLQKYFGGKGHPDMSN